MRKLIFVTFFLLFTTILFTQSASFANAQSWRDKVDGWVLETAVPDTNAAASTKTYPQTEFLVQLTEQADLSGAEALLTKEEKGRYVYEQLTAVANRTQPAVIAELERLGVTYKPFWVANMIWVEGDIYAVQAMALRDDVAHLYANPTVTQAIEPPAVQPLETSGIWDSIGFVGAKDVWALGYRGQGVVIGGQDTGYEWDHPALIDAYRGWDGDAADHNYSWHDAWRDTFPCSVDEPCDDHSHGTHTMGTMVGNVNEIGMAPDAQWIGCRNMHSGNGTPASYTDCYQWFIAPTDLNDLNPDFSKAPDVINNSWGCPPSEGCNPDSLATVVAAVRAAGIVTVHSAGNDGPSCGSSSTPGTIYDQSFSVGATGENTNQIAGFSSRGPITVDGSNRMKPDISAPGVNIYSSVLNDGYGVKSGTSMAAPHVAGMVALILSARPDLKGNVHAIEEVIQDTAVKLTTTQGCGSDTATSIPNNVYGYGRIDAQQALFLLTAEYRYYWPVVLKE